MSKLGEQPAFPMQHTDPDGRHDVLLPGMTLRQYFAGQVMVGLLSYCGDRASGSWHNNATPEAVAQQTCKLADALIAELEKPHA